MHIPKWLIATAGLLIVVLIAAVAFFIGRQTQPSQAPAGVTASAPAASSPSNAPPPEPATSAAQPGDSAMTAPASTPSAPPASEPAVIASAPLSNPPAPTPVETSSVTADARARVSAYFRQMDSMQSGGPGGDADAFANTIMQGAASGDFSGLDDLVRTATDAERRAAALQPPAECAEYHRKAVALLQESTAMITSLRDGLKRNDADALTSMAASAQTMKLRADNLAAAEKSLRARFGL